MTCYYGKFEPWVHIEESSTACSRFVSFFLGLAEEILRGIPDPSLVAFPSSVSSDYYV